MTLPSLKFKINVTSDGEKQLVSTELSDVTLVGKDEQSNEAHKFILGASSGLFTKTMNYKSNQSNLLKKMTKQSKKAPIKAIIRSESMKFEFSSGAFSEVILPLMLGMKVGDLSVNDQVEIEILSNEQRNDLIETPDSNLIRVEVRSKSGEKAHVTIHVYLQTQGILIQGTQTFHGVPIWRYFCNTYLAPLLVSVINSKEAEIASASAEIARKARDKLNCSKCRVGLRQTGAVDCKICEKKFHKKCTDSKHMKNLTEKEHVWVCPPCRSTPASASTPPVSPALIPPHSLTALYSPPSPQELAAPTMLAIRRTAPADLEQAAVLAPGGGPALLTLPSPRVQGVLALGGR